MRGISQSLAGRVRPTSLLPFSLAELSRRDAPAMCDLLAAGPRQPSPEGTWTAHGVRGFYPRIHDLGLDAGEWLAQYFQTYLERDVRDLTQVGDLEAFGRFVRLCAGRAGGLLNLSSLGNDCGVSHDTAALAVGAGSAAVLAAQPEADDHQDESDDRGRHVGENQLGLLDPSTSAAGPLCRHGACRR